MNSDVFPLPSGFSARNSATVMAPREAAVVTPPPSLAATPPPVAPPSSSPSRRRTFVPAEPRTLVEAGLTDGDVERLVLKLLLFRGTSTGRGVADHLKLPRPMVVEALERLRSELLVAIKGSAGLEDYAFQLT
jgi:hypothetical protein